MIFYLYIPQLLTDNFFSSSRNHGSESGGVNAIVNQVRQSLPSAAGLFYSSKQRKQNHMMTRKERRAAEHAARKADRKAGFPQSEPTAAAAPSAPVETTIEAEPAIAPNPPTSKKEISEAQLAANRRNALLSHGPTTEAGREKVSRNAVKTGLTGAQVLLPTDDAALYEAQVLAYKNAFEPVGPEETHLLQSIIDTRFRLDRIPGLESALLELARRQLIKEEPGLANNPAPVLEMQARIHAEKHLRNLYLQEGRLVRRREREMKELRELQATRKAAEQTNAKTKPAQQPITEPKNGTVFSPPVLDNLVPETRAEFPQDTLESAAQAEEATKQAA
jgi:hypothetical protein